MGYTISYNKQLLNSVKKPSYSNQLITCSYFYKISTWVLLLIIRCFCLSPMSNPFGEPSWQQEVAQYWKMLMNFQTKSPLIVRFERFARV